MPALTGVGTRWRSVDSFAAGISSANPPLSVRELELHDLAHWAAEGKDPARSPLALTSERLRVGIGASQDRMGEDFTRFDGNVGVGLVSPFTAEAPMSATRLEAYAKCPRRFLYDRVLQVSRRTLPEEIWQMEPTERGTLVHAILEDYLLERLDGAPRSLPRLLAIAEAQFAVAEGGGLVGKPLLWRMDKAALVRDLVRFHDEEGDLEPLAAELEFGTGAEGADPAVTVTLADGHEVRFKGKADRVDRTRSGELVVSDYKTGRQGMLKSLKKDPVAGGRLLQLPIYAMAAQARFGGETVQARYWLLSAKRVRAPLLPHHHSRSPGAFRRCPRPHRPGRRRRCVPGRAHREPRRPTVRGVPGVRLRRRVPGGAGPPVGAQARRPRGRPGAGAHGHRGPGRARRGGRRRVRGRPRASSS